MSRKMFLVVLWLFIFACGQQQSPPPQGGTTVTQEQLGETVVVDDDSIAKLVLTSTYKTGFAVILVSLTSKSPNFIIPKMDGTNTYAYLVTVKDSNGNALRSETFGITDFGKQFDSTRLGPGLTYSEYEYVYPWDIPNDVTGGIMRADVWLAEENNPDIIHHIYGETNLTIKYLR